MFDECKWEIFRKKNASKPNLADGECSMMQKLPGKTPKQKYPISFHRAATRDKLCDIRGRGVCPVRKGVPSNLEVVLFMRKRALI
jgi:hypothetical protein